MAGSYADIIKRKQREWNSPNLMEGANQMRSAKIPFSSPLLSWMTYGGVPRNKITEFFGAPSSGKTTTCIDVCKNAVQVFKSEHEAAMQSLRDEIAKGNKSAQSQLEDLQEQGPKKVLYIDLEHAFDTQWAKTLGIEDSDIDIMQPPDVVAEDILQTTQELIETGEIGLMVLDSLPSLVPKSELEKKFGERTVASLAGLLTIYCRKIVPLLTRYETTMIFINQIRENMDNPYVVKTPGGEAVKFYSCLRILFQSGSPVDFLGNELPKSSENPSGYLVQAKVQKQKSAPNDRKSGSYYLMIQSGIRADMDYAILAVKKYDIIHKSGAWFTLTDPTTGEIMEKDGKAVKLNGMSAVFDYLQTNPEYYAKLKTYIMNDINGATSDPEISEESPMFDVEVS